MIPVGRTPWSAAGPLAGHTNLILRSRRVGQAFVPAAAFQAARPFRSSPFFDLVRSSFLAFLFSALSLRLCVSAVVFLTLLPTRSLQQ